jgi:hypothetical protein
MSAHNRHYRPLPYGEEMSSYRALHRIDGSTSPLTLVYLHLEDALCFKHIELCGVRVHCSVVTPHIDDYVSVRTRSHCLAFHVFSLSHQRVPTGGPDQREPEDKTNPTNFKYALY